MTVPKKVATSLRVTGTPRDKLRTETKPTATKPDPRVTDTPAVKATGFALATSYSEGTSALGAKSSVLANNTRAGTASSQAPPPKLWMHRPFSRVVKGWRAYKIVRAYITLNELEATGKIPYQVARLKGIGPEVIGRFALRFGLIEFLV